MEQAEVGGEGRNQQPEAVLVFAEVPEVERDQEIGREDGDDQEQPVRADLFQHRIGMGARCSAAQFGR